MEYLCKYPALSVTLVGAAFLISGLSVGCAPRNNAALERAQASYLQAQQNPDVVTYAPTHLQEARTILDRAEHVWEDDGDSQEVSHLSYLAEQKANIAVVTAQQKIVETEEQQLVTERDQLLLSARTLEADRARQQAEAAAARASRAEQELAALKAKETERGLMMTLQDDVLFEYDKADLKPGAMRNLSPLVTFLREHPNRTLLIEGHTDSTGSDSYNTDLSRRRAEAVAAFLIHSGISPERIIARGYGESYPVAANDNEAGRQQNRRVDIVISHEGQRVVERYNARP
jgi:OOP family OmpA-OmpF porin